MAGKQLTDELDDLPVAKPAAAPKKAAPQIEEEEDEKAAIKSAKTAAAATATSNSAAAEEEMEDEDLSVEFGDRELMKKTGMLERLRPEKGKAVRFAMLTDFVKARSAFTHFIDKKGTYRCLVDKIKRTKREAGGDPDAEGYCCKKLKEESERLFVALVLYYKNANAEDGGYEKGATIDWEIRYVQLTQANFRQISRLIEEESTVNDMDIVMTHADRAFGYDFHRKAPKPRWRGNPQLVEEVKEKLKPFMDGNKLDARLGKKVSDVEMRALIASLGPAAEDARLGDVDSL